MRGEGAHTRDSDLRDTPPRETLRTMGASGSDPRTGQDPTRQLGPQHVVWFCTILLLAFGVVMVYSTAAVVSMFQGSSGFSYFLDQVAVAVGGLILMIIVSRLDYRRWRAWSLAPMVLALTLLVLVLIPGIAREAGGATRWLRIGSMGFQPSELAKLSIVLAAAYLLAVAGRRTRSSGESALPWEYLVSVLGLASVTCLLIYFQPDMGTTVLIGVVVLGMLVLAGMRGIHVATLVLLSSAVAMYGMLSEPYRRERLTAFLDPTADPLNSGYQLIQSFVAMANGGWFGVGPGRSTQKFSWLPEAHTDMIFAIIGEEYGFVGAAVVIGLFLLLTLAVWRIARESVDPFGRYLAGGVMLLMSGQAILNLGGVLGALPLTGIPLPFISFGRSNLLVMLIAMGVVLSVARYGTVGSIAPASQKMREVQASNVTYLDSRRRHRGSRGSRPGRR